MSHQLNKLLDAHRLGECSQNDEALAESQPVGHVLPKPSDAELALKAALQESARTHAAKLAAVVGVYPC